MNTGMVLAAGAVAAALLVAALRRWYRSPRRPLAVALVVAALIYVGFALQAPVPSGQLPVELLGVAVFGALAWCGLRGSAWWLVAGWALHPVWDVGLHLLGPATTGAPVWYAQACLGFDLVVAGYLAWHLRRQGADTAVATGAGVDVHTEAETRADVGAA